MAPLFEVPGFSGDDLDVWGQTLGWVGTLGAWTLFLSPIPTMRIIWKERDVQEFTEATYIASLANCMLWVLYAFVTPGRLQPLITNIGGMLLQLSYCCVFVKCSTGGPRARDIRFRMTCTVVGLAIVTVFVFGIIPAKLFHMTDFMGMVDDDDQTDVAMAQSDVLGLLCLIFNIFMYAGPLAVVGEVIETKSVASMPLTITLGTLLCSLCWASYGLYVGDIFIGIPNWMGIVLGLAQICLYYTYAGDSDQSPSGKPNWWVDGNLKNEATRGSDAPYHLI